MEAISPRAPNPASKMVVKFTSPRGEEQIVTVTDRPIVVGRRGTGTNLVLQGDERVSRRHGRVWLKDDGVWYEDLGSAHGSWRSGQRLEDAVRLQAGEPVVLGETTMVLLDDDPANDLPPDLEGMELVRQSSGDVHDIADAMASSRRGASFVAALYEFVQALLRSTSHELVPLALRRIHDGVPAASRIALVAWPPDPQDGIRHVLPLEDSRASGIPSGPISTSLAAYAANRRRALHLSETSRPVDLELGSSVLDLRIRSAIYVPIEAAAGDVGWVLCVETPEAGLPYSNQDFQYICAVAGLLGTALAMEGMRQETLRIQREQQRSEAHREALATFLKIAGHDLKDPLAAIRMASGALARLLERPLEREALDIIQGGERRAQELIDSYLKVATIEAGRSLAIDWQDVDLRTLVEDEIRFVSATQGHRSTLELTHRIPPTIVRADPQKLRQIFDNLLSNAVKYSPGGGVVLVSATASGGQVEVRVADQGVGIAAADRERVFAELSRVGDLSLAPGTGLGLWLAAELVSAHGSTLRVESTPGQGSTFIFNLHLGRT